MQKQIIGHVVCPVCGHPDAEVKTDKNGHAFIFCTDCAAQTFTRNDYRHKRLTERMRPVTVTVTEQSEQISPPVTVTKLPEPKEPSKQPVTAKKTSIEVTVQEKTKEAPKSTPDKPAVKKTSWFQPILGAN